MQARRTFEHGPMGGWSSIALHLEAAGPSKEGFFLTVFPDARPPATVFLRAAQMQQLIDMAADSAVNDQQLWEFVAKVPMEPLLPARSLYARLRSLLVDSAANIRAEVRAQLERQPPKATPIADDEPGAAPAPQGGGPLSAPAPVDPGAGFARDPGGAGLGGNAGVAGDHARGDSDEDDGGEGRNGDPSFSRELP